MYSFGPESLANLYEAKEPLRNVFLEVIKTVDCSVIEGRREKQEQNYLYKVGRSQLQYPFSKHNCEEDEECDALDVVPYPIDWDNIERFKNFCWFVKGVAAGQGVEIISGGLDWIKFKDYPHFELKGVNK